MIFIEISILVTKPEHDSTTYYLSKWFEPNIRLIEEKGIKLTKLEKQNANRKNFESYLKNNNYSAIFLNGHGSDKVIGGHNDEELLIAGENEHLLKSKIIYAISCKSGSILGPNCINKGAISYTGYSKEFIFECDNKMYSRPLKDKLAKLYLEPAQSFVQHLIKGCSVGESTNKIKEGFYKNIYDLLSTASKDNIWTVKLLWWNQKHLITHGDTNATL